MERADIQKVACPTCNAEPGKPCFHKGKGAFKKAQLGVSHIDRMKHAQAQLPSLQVIDWKDDPALWPLNVKGRGFFRSRRKGGGRA